ncbi:FG-GAP repeat domain-containing protein [Streptomyces sp. NPDC090109]|uniref:FG-GAP repeat domain-containing protein n=1 Tax=Streptomyces sp. NPDC090109 TaxID=3365948 RepID=UPI0037FE8A38
MLFTRSRRARRVAACTALALSAGMLLAGTASADTPAPRPATEKPAPAAEPLKRVLPPYEGTARATGASDAGTAPRSDLDGDGRGDLIYRVGGTVYTTTTQNQGSEFSGFNEFAEDIIPLGDQDGNGSGPEVLTVSKFGAATLYGDASPSYAYQRWSGAGWQIYNKIFSPGDISGDGRADVLARTPSGELWVYVSTGTYGAPFHARQKVGNGWGVYDHLIGLGDSDGDGRGDFLARTPSGVLFYYGSTGSPYSVKARKQVGYGWQEYNQIVGIDDDNGNGIPDLLARGSDGTLWEYFGTGSGHFTARKQVGSQWGGAYQIGGAGNVPAHGKEGLLARDKAGSLYWYNTLGTGRLSPRDQLGETGEALGATLYEVNSLDRDSVSDTLQIFQGGLYSMNAYLGSGWGAINLIAGPGDLNGDGTGDFVARDKSGVLWLYRSNYDGTALHARVRVGGGWDAYNAIVGSGDYTGDGRNDLVARDRSGVLWLYPGTGQAGAPFHARVKVGGGWNSYTKLAAPGDITGDGKGDLVAVNSGGELFRYSGTGEKGNPFKPRVSIGHGYQTYNNLY